MIFVDALDECSHQNGTMDRFIAELSTLQLHAHVFVTSRFSPSPESRLSADYQLEIRASDADIHRYLDSRIHNEHRLGRLLGNNQALKDAMITQIINNADGMYVLSSIFAHLNAQIKI